MTAKTTKTEARSAKPAAPAKGRPVAPAPAPAKAKAPKSPFNRKDAEAYRALLLELKDKLVRDVRMNQEASNEGPDGDVLDTADQASDSYDRDLANSLSEAERGRLASVEEALKRVDEGRYGLCSHCAKPIPLARLRVLPFARLCVPCQQGEEGGRGASRGGSEA